MTFKRNPKLRIRFNYANVYLNFFCRIYDIPYSHFSWKHTRNYYIEMVCHRNACSSYDVKHSLFY